MAARVHGGRHKTFCGRGRHRRLVYYSGGQGRVKPELPKGSLAGHVPLAGGGRSRHKRMKTKEHITAGRKRAASLFGHVPGKRVDRHDGLEPARRECIGSRKWGYARTDVTVGHAAAGEGGCPAGVSRTYLRAVIVVSKACLCVLPPRQGGRRAARGRQGENAPVDGAAGTEKAAFLQKRRLYKNFL